MIRSRCLTNLWLVLLSCAVISSACAQVQPQSMEQPPVENDKPRLENVLPSPRALTLSIQDGVIKWVNGRKTANITVSLDLIPEDLELQRTILRQPTTVEVKEFRIPNSWFVKRAQSPDRLEERLSLIISGLDLPEGPTAEARLTKALLDRKNLDLLGTDVITVPEWFAQQRDRALLRYLFDGSGMRLSLQASDAKPTVRDESLTWVVRRVRIPRTRQGNTTYLDRWSITLFDQPLTITLPTTAAEVTLRALAEWIGRSEVVSFLDPPTLDLGGTTLSLKAPTDKPISDEERKDRASYLEAGLKLTGSNLGELVLKGLLSGSQYSSPFTGMLVSKGTVKPIVGISMEQKTSGPIRPGLVVGVLPGDSSLFFGPRISLDLLQVSLGLQVRTGNNAGDSLNSRVAGAISMDLSRLTGGKKEITKLSIQNPTTGGGWGKSSRELSKNIAAVQTRIFVQKSLLDNQQNYHARILYTRNSSPDDPAMSAFEVSRSTSGGKSVMIKVGDQVEEFLELPTAVNFGIAGNYTATPSLRVVMGSMGRPGETVTPSLRLQVVTPIAGNLTLQPSSDGFLKPDLNGDDSSRSFKHDFAIVRSPTSTQ